MFSLRCRLGIPPAPRDRSRLQLLLRPPDSEAPHPLDHVMNCTADRGPILKCHNLLERVLCRAQLGCGCCLHCIVLGAKHTAVRADVHLGVPRYCAASWRRDGTCCAAVTGGCGVPLCDHRPRPQAAPLRPRGGDARHSAAEPAAEPPAPVPMDFHC